MDTLVEQTARTYLQGNNITLLYGGMTVFFGQQKIPYYGNLSGGEAGIRTLGTV
jgi:hypothetical protein